MATGKGRRIHSQFKRFHYEHCNLFVHRMEGQLAPCRTMNKKKKMLKLGIEPKTFALLARRSNQLSYSSTVSQLRQRRKRIIIIGHSACHTVQLHLGCYNEDSHCRTDLCTMLDYANSRKSSCRCILNCITAIEPSFSSNHQLRV